MQNIIDRCPLTAYEYRELGVFFAPSVFSTEHLIEVADKAMAQAVESSKEYRRTRDDLEHWEKHGCSRNLLDATRNVLILEAATTLGWYLRAANCLELVAKRNTDPLNITWNTHLEVCINLAAKWEAKLLEIVK